MPVFFPEEKKKYLIYKYSMHSPVFTTINRKSKWLIEGEEGWKRGWMAEGGFITEIQRCTYE